MNKPFSIYLDLVRFLAACLVYLRHSNQRWLTNDTVTASNFGHTSVIVFFVLSGFVIAYITDTREKRPAAYAASRISRIYSVALPAVLLTITLDAVGRQLYPAIYAYPFDNFLVRAAASLLMLNEVWFISITSFSNVPYWSIGYEMWYYVAFGIFMFVPGRARWMALALLALALGPKVVMLAPVWGLGVLLYRWQRLQNLSEPVGWLLVTTSWMAFAAFHQADMNTQGSLLFRDIVGSAWHLQFTFSQHFMTDYLLGAVVCMNFAGMRAVGHRFGPLLSALERPIRFLAGYTLTLYLLHQPLYLFWAAVIRGDPSGPAYWWMTTGMVAASVFVIGYVTENRRHLFKTWIEHRLSRIETTLSRRYAPPR